MDTVLFSLLAACVGVFALVQLLLALAIGMGVRDLFAPTPVPVPVKARTAPRRAA
ncbi:hypothetical protein [Oleisolibacter albus]|uniref:hypothetical protein n=1 Tax=Oleisolibacter albus TaxID=2171757 RepID=UPI0012D7DA21|nr:hypothetical protein [Oleisolibacter albus]